MLIRTAEESFELGRQAFGEGRHREAMAFFEAAIRLEKEFGSDKPQARYLSHYGLCLSSVTSRKHEAVQFCREATAIESYNADMYWNLGRTLLAVNRRRDAYQALLSGLGLHPRHPGIVGELKRMGLRRKPALPFLSRGHPINVFFGRLRSR